MALFSIFRSSYLTSKNIVFLFKTLLMFYSNIVQKCSVLCKPPLTGHAPLTLNRPSRKSSPQCQHPNMTPRYGQLSLAPGRASSSLGSAMIVHHPAVVIVASFRSFSVRRLVVGSSQSRLSVPVDVARSLSFASELSVTDTNVLVELKSRTISCLIAYAVRFAYMRSRM